jgi:hypothetical protein
MNRADRRTIRRRVLAALKAEGCTCTPKIEPDQGAPGGTVEHEADCALLWRLAAADFPTLWVEGPRECGR